MNGIEPNKPFDREAKWGYCNAKKKWIYGYGIHLTAIATPKNPVFPILTELTTANEKGLDILEGNFSKIPSGVKHIVVDAEADSKNLYLKSNQRLITPIRDTANWKTREKTMSKQRRKRKEFFESEKGRQLSRIRGTTIEQLFNVLKNIFGTEVSWFYGKDYTETLVFTAVWAYQIFVAYSLYNKLPFRRIQRIKPFLDRL